MKKFFGLMFAVVAIVGFTACESNFEGETNTPVVNGVREFVASFDETRTALAGLNVVWSEGDKISVNDSVFELVEGAGSTVARFVLVEGNNPVVAPFTAVYPANATSLAANVAEGTFANGANIAVAVGEDTNLIFNNVLSVLKFQVPQNCSNITVEATQPVLGGFTVNANGTITAAGNGSKTISLDGNFVTGKTYYTTLLPQTTSLVIRIDGYLSSEKDSKAMNGNKIYNLNTLPAPEKSEISIIGSMTNNWNFSNKAPMYKDNNGYYVIKNFQLDANATFKFVGTSATGWSDTQFNYGSGATLDKGNAYRIWSNGGDNKNKTAGKYDIYFSEAKGYFFLVAAGTTVVDNTIKLVSDAYGFVGNFNGNNWGTNVSMFVNGKYLAAKGVKFNNTTAEYKIRQLNDWNNGEQFGQKNSTGCALGYAITIGGSNNFKFNNVSTSEVYDIYTNFNKTTVVKSGAIANLE